mgnify:FL=1
MPVKYEYNEVKSNELYNLKEDPSEMKNVYMENIEKAKELEKMGENARQELGDELTSRIGDVVRKIGTID